MSLSIFEYSKYLVTVPVLEGKAIYKNIAYGVYTIGEIADDGNTSLELDLADPAL